MKKHLAFTLIAVVTKAFWVLPLLPAAAPQVDDQARKKMEKIVAKSGLGKKARITVKTRDKNILKGFVVRVGDRDFSLNEAKSNQEKTVMYSDVTSVSGSRSLGAKIAIGAAIWVGAVTAVVLIACAAGRCPGN